MKYDYDRQRLKSELNFIIRQHYRSPSFNVSMMAALMGIGERSLYRLCKKHLSVTPIQLIQTFKITQAKQLLKTELVGEEIAKRAGYHCKSAFLQAFKKETGVCPTKYLGSL